MLITLQDLQTTFAAAGVYTVYQDNTQQPQIVTSSNLRLVVGFSKYGIFNRPTYIQQGDYATATTLYGPNDISLEHNGSWFHRSLTLALAQSDVLALNLLALDNETDLTTGLPTVNADTVDYRSFSVDIAAANGIPTEKLFSSFYNKQRFWTPDRNYLLATRSYTDQGSLFNFTNLSQVPCSFICTKSTIKGFDVQVSQWYANLNQPIPAYLNPSDLISDYFIDVVCINGDYGPDNYAQLATDAVMGQYFDAAGLKSNKLAAFLALPTIGIRAIFTGCLIPAFKDGNGTNRFIEDVINGSVDSNLILCAVDKKQLDSFATSTNTKYLDMVGHRLLTNVVDSIDMLSYKQVISEDFLETEVSTNSMANLNMDTGVTLSTTPGKITVTVDSSNPDFTTLGNNIFLGMLFAGVTTSVGLTNGITVSNPVLNVSRLLKTATTIVFDLSCPLKDSETATSGVFVTLDIQVIGSSNIESYESTNNRFYLDGTNTYYIADKGSPIFASYMNGDLQDGDTITDGSNTYYIQYTVMFANGGVDTADDFRTILKLSLFSDVDLTIPVSTGSAIAFGASYDSNGYGITDPTLLDIISQLGSMDARLPATKLTNTSVRIPIAYASLINQSHYMVGFALDGVTPMMSRILTIKNYTASGPTPTHIDVTINNPVKIFTAVDGTTMIERFIPFENYISHLDLTMLSGFTLTASHLPDGTDARMYEILDVLFDTNLAEAVTDPEMISFRYFVDTFNGGLEATSKMKWTNLAMARQTCIALLNTPSMQQFIDSSNPRFTDSPTPANPVPELDIDYIVTGGNLAENPDFQYSLPQNDNGGDYAGFFAPNLIFSDAIDGTISMPPAPLVSNNFVARFTSGGNPFLPVAGLKRGVLTAPGLQGVEYPLTQTQRGQFETLGINPIYKRKDGTIVIMGSETPYQRFSSALNNLYVRDMLITMTQDMDGILEGYTWEYNEPSSRIEINGLLSNYLGNLVSGYGCIQPGYTVVFDSSNNPQAIISENAGIVDVSIQPTYVFKRFINRITLTNGGNTSSGFVAV